MMLRYLRQLILCKHKLVLISRFYTTRSGQTLRLRPSQQRWECCACGKTWPLQLYNMKIHIHGEIENEKKSRISVFFA
jgi:hypothetical protein